MNGIKKIMKRKSVLAVLITLALTEGTFTGCGNKETDVKGVPKVESNEVSIAKAATFNTTKLGNLIVNEPAKLSDLLYEVLPEKGQTLKSMALSYEDKSITLEVGKDLETGGKDTKEVKPFTLVKIKDAKVLFGKTQVPNMTIAFPETTETPANLNVSVTLEDKNKKTSKAETDINIVVLPETIKPVKAITENLKLSQSLKDYDFDVRAKNIADKVDNKWLISGITVKKSNVIFGKVGQYEVSYEIKTKVRPKMEVVTEVEVIDKETEQTLSKDDVVTENVEVTTTVEEEKYR